MPLKDLSGKSVLVLDLDRGDFEKLFCCQCHEYDYCDRSDSKILSCKAFVDTGLWDMFYRKRNN